MNEKDSRKIKHYFKQIRLLIPVRSKGVKRFLQDFRNAVEEYQEEHPECSAEDIMERFGSPEDVAYEYVSSVDSEEICRRITISKFVRRAIGIIVIVAVIAAGYRVWMLYDIHQQAEDAYISREVIVIE